jgi:hypothetical protein
VPLSFASLSPVKASEPQAGGTLLRESLHIALVVTNSMLQYMPQQARQRKAPHGKTAFTAAPLGASLVASLKRTSGVHMLQHAADNEWAAPLKGTPRNKQIRHTSETMCRKIPTDEAPPRRGATEL